jgi:glycosyltransferase involved in cell wall biosynthesis
MLYIDVGNTLRGGLKTGIQRVVRALAFELANGNPNVSLIAFDPAADRYFALCDPERIRSAESMAALGAAERRYFDLDALERGDIFFEPDSTWSEPIPRAMLFRRLKAKGVIVVILNHDVIPVLLPEVCHPNTLISFPEAVADQLQYADYALATSRGVERDLLRVAERYLGRSVTTRVITLGADFETASNDLAADDDNLFPELASLRYLLAVGTIEPRKNYEILLQAFDRLDAQDAALVIVGRKGWMSEEFAASLERHSDFGKRLFWYTAVEDQTLLELYRGAFAAVLPSLYEGYGLPAVEALTQGCPTIVSDAGSLPEVTRGHAAVFDRSDSEALFAILDRLYRDEAYRAELRQRAAGFRPTSWQDAGQSVRAALDDIAHGRSYNFAHRLRQMVYLSIHPEILDLSLASVRRNLTFIDRIVVLTKPETKVAIENVAARHFRDATILTDADLLGATPLSTEHNLRNAWLRKLLYRHEVNEPNFLASDEDYLALKPLPAERFLKDGGVHTGHYFLEDMGTWLAGSPRPTSYDRGIRNAWRLLKEAAYPTRGFASHMPQIINKSLVSEIYDRLMISPDQAWLDEWSIYFNIAGALYPRHFEAKPYAALGWPMQTGDWYPEIAPEDPAFENYYAENYKAGGLFAGLDPLGDLEEKTARTLRAFARARGIEVEGGGAHTPSPLALIIGEDGLTFLSEGTIVAGRNNVRRVLVMNGSLGALPRGKLEMFVTEPLGAPVFGESIMLGEPTWIPLLPPEEPGLYAVRFFASLENGAKLETNGLLTVIADKETELEAGNQKENGA